MALHLGAAPWRADGKLFGSVCDVVIDGHKILLFKPATFMNESGKAVRALLNFYKIEPSEMLVVHDELDLDAGIARLKFDGGHGGQNGLRDIVRVLGGNGKFHRLRIGIGHPGHKERVTGHVLGRPSASEADLMLSSIADAASVLPMYLAGRTHDAMTQLHTKN